MPPGSFAVNVFYLPDGRLRAGWRLLLGVIVAILANLIAANIASLLGARGPLAFDLLYRPIAMALLIAGFSGVLLWADRIQGSPLDTQGLPLRHWRHDSLAGFAIGFTLIFISVVVLGIFGDLDFRVTVNRETVLRLAVVLLILSTGAMTEELMFRGYPFQRLVEGVGAVPAIVLLSVMFGLAHLKNPHSSAWAIANTVSVGVLLSVAYLRSRALWLPWGIHFGWNATLGVVFGLPVSGLTDFAVIVKGTARGPHWLTGGSYGLEASALGTAVILLGFLPVLMMFRRPPQSPAELPGVLPFEQGRSDVPGPAF